MFVLAFASIQVASVVIAVIRRDFVHDLIPVGGVRPNKAEMWEVPI